MHLSISALKRLKIHCLIIANRNTKSCKLRIFLFLFSKTLAVSADNVSHMLHKQSFTLRLNRDTVSPACSLSANCVRPGRALRRDKSRRMESARNEVDRFGQNIVGIVGIQRDRHNCKRPYIGVEVGTDDSFYSRKLIKSRKNSRRS